MGTVLARGTQRGNEGNGTGHPTRRPVLITSLNSLDLARLLDPGRTPLLAPARSVARLAADGLGRRPRDRVRPTRHPSWAVRRQLRRSGLTPIRQATVGFGPFNVLGSPLLSGDQAIRVDQAFQRRADHNSKLLRCSGRLQLIPALKPDPGKSSLRLDYIVSY